MGIIDASEDIVTRTFESESFDSLLADLATEIEFRNYRVTRIYDIDNIFDQPERGSAPRSPSNATRSSSSATSEAARS